MNENQIDSTPTDDINSGGPTEQELLDAVMANSPIMEEAGIPLPAEEENVQDPVDEGIPDPDAEEAVSEDEEEEVYEEEEETEGEDDEDSTQDPDVYTSDDLDLDALVTVKVDGEEMNVSFGDLLKGYQTDAHLSKKGRELSEAQQAVEAERNERLQQLVQMGDGVNAMLMQTEQGLAKQYHDIEAKIQKARDEGDTYEVNELKDQREQVQKKYHEAKSGRENMLSAINQQKQQAEAEMWQKQINYFQETIPTLVPDFNEEMAGSIRQFAIDEGLSPDILDTIVDPMVVKVINDYRILKTGVEKGAAKRKATPAKKAKALPTRKAKPENKKKQDAAKMVKARAMREDASPDDHMAFLRQFADKSLNQ